MMKKYLKICSLDFMQIFSVFISSFIMIYKTSNIELVDILLKALYMTPFLSYVMFIFVFPLSWILNIYLIKNYSFSKLLGILILQVIFILGLIIWSLFYNNYISSSQDITIRGLVNFRGYFL